MITKGPLMTSRSYGDLRPLIELASSVPAQPTGFSWRQNGGEKENNNDLMGNGLTRQQR